MDEGRPVESIRQLTFVITPFAKILIFKKRRLDEQDYWVW
jgi:hypothetical protein